MILKLCFFIICPDISVKPLIKFCSMWKIYLLCIISKVCHQDFAPALWCGNSYFDMWKFMFFFLWVWNLFVLCSWFFSVKVWKFMFHLNRFVHVVFHVKVIFSTHHFVSWQSYKFSAQLELQYRINICCPFYPSCFRFLVWNISPSWFFFLCMFLFLTRFICPLSFFRSPCHEHPLWLLIWS